MSDALYSKQFTTDDKDFTVQYYTDDTDDYYEGNDNWVHGHHKGISIVWSCSDTIGPWSIEEFARLLKVIAKTSSELLYRSKFGNDYYLVYLDKERGAIMYNNTTLPSYDQRGPLLADLRAALRGIKAKVKTNHKREVPAS